MKKTMPLTILLISILLLNACSGMESSASPPITAEQIPDDFGFIYTRNSIEIDTFNSTIMNAYYFDEGYSDAIADHSFSDEELLRIYMAFIQYDIYYMPEEIDPNKDVMCIPPTTYTFVYTLNGETKRVACYTGGTVNGLGVSRKNNKFAKFMEKVWSYVSEDSAYKGLPDGPMME